MCLHGALRSIPFNLICNMTTFRKKCFDGTTRATGMCKDRICACFVLYATLFNLICNMTTFRKNVLTIPLGRRVCVKTEYVLGWCSMPRALCPIPFNLICNMTTFRKKYFDLLTPPPGRGCVGVKYLPPCCFMRHPFNLIINMTLFW